MCFSLLLKDTKLERERERESESMRKKEKDDKQNTQHTGREKPSRSVYIGGSMAPFNLKGKLQKYACLNYYLCTDKSSIFL